MRRRLFLRHAATAAVAARFGASNAAIGKLAPAATREEMQDYPGGGLFELACHLIDAVVTVLGRPAEVRACSTPTRDDGVKDNQLAVLVYPRATATIRCNHADPFGGPRRFLSVTGTQGTMEIRPLESGRFWLSLLEPREGLPRRRKVWRTRHPEEPLRGGVCRPGSGRSRREKTRLERRPRHHRPRDGTAGRRRGPLNESLFADGVGGSQKLSARPAAPTAAAFLFFLGPRGYGRMNQDRWRSVATDRATCGA